MHATELRDSSGAEIGFHGYRSDVDKFFSKRLHDPNAPNPLKQDMPPRIFEIVDLLSKGTKVGRVEIYSYLLDLAGDWRDQLAEGIDNDLTSQPTLGRPRPFSTHGDVRLTVYCWMDGYAPRAKDAAVDHARTVMLLNEDSSRLLLELSYTTAGVLRDVNWQKLVPSDIPAADLSKLKEAAEKLRANRLNKARATGKIGRNESCPCGSGKKYKKCCMRK